MERDTFGNEQQRLAYDHWAGVYALRVVREFNKFRKTMTQHGLVAEQSASDLEALIPHLLLDPIMRAENDPETLANWAYASLQAAHETLASMIQDYDLQEPPS